MIRIHSLATEEGKDMNPFLQLLGLVILLAPAILTVVVLVAVRRSSKQVQAELHALRADLDRLASQGRTNS